MRKITDIHDAMTVGSEWKVSSTSSQLFRVTRRLTRYFCMEGPLDAPRKEWKEVCVNWPRVREVVQWLPDGFVLKRSGRKTAYEKAEGVEG